MTDQPEASNIENAAAIIERFGGIRPMATKMGVPVTTVQGWKKRDVIPANRRADVLEAAAAHDVVLDDLLAEGAAKMADSAVQDFSHTLETAPLDDDAQARHAAAITAGRRTAAQDDLIRSIRAAEKRAVKTSTWVSLFLVTSACALGALLLWPTKQEVKNNAHRVSALEVTVAQVRDSQGDIRKLLPANIGEKIGNLQQQASEIQGRIAAATQHAEQMAGVLLDGELPARMAQLETQMRSFTNVSDIGSVIDRLKNLQASEDGQSLLSGAVSELNELLSNFGGSPEELDQALLDVQGDDSALGTTLDGVSPTDLRAAAMLVGLSQFRTSLHRSGPFEDDLQVLKKLIGQDDAALNAAIDRLAPRAAQGVLTPAGLSAEFRGMAGDIVVSSLKGEDVSLQEKAKARFNDIMQVQKDGELVTGTDTQATVARAQKMLDDGNVQGAIAELQKLDGEAAETAQPFVQEALATLNAEQVQEMMTGTVLERLQALTGGGMGNVGAGAHTAVTGMALSAQGGIRDLTREIKDLGRTMVSTPDGNFSVMVPGPKMPGQSKAGQ